MGVGGQGGSNLRNFSRVKIGDKAAVNVVALCDVDSRRLDDASKLHPQAQTFADFRRMLDQAGKTIDAVVVSTPDHTHAVTSLAALGLGKHVYCEKPLAHSVFETRRMAEAASRARVASQMGNQGQSSDNTRRIVEIVRSGAIGPVREVHAWSDRPIWPQGMERRPEAQDVPKWLDWDLWLGPAANRPYSGDYLPFKWRGWWDFGTGALGDMACHVVNAAFWALDLKSPSTVEAQGEPHSPESGPKSETIAYEFPARGEKPPVTLTWYDGGRKPPDDLLTDGEKWSRGGSLLVGEKGKLYVPDDYGGKHVLLPKKDFEGFRPPPETIRRVGDHHRDFIEACKSPIDRPASSNFGYSGPLTEMVLLGIVAFRVGKKIEWDGPALRVTNSSEADALLRPEFRGGWSL